MGAAMAKESIPSQWVSNRLAKQCGGCLMCSRCRKEYEKGKANRQEYPKYSGRALILEAWRVHSSDLDSLRGLGEFGCMPFPDQDSESYHVIGHCKAIDGGFHTTKLPQDICRDLAELEHGVEMLRKDGVKTRVVDELENALSSRIPDLIELAELACKEGSRPWHERARELSRGVGHLYELVDGYVRLLEDVMREAEIND
jgi:hypothetical protein